MNIQNITICLIILIKFYTKVLYQYTVGTAHKFQQGVSKFHMTIKIVTDSTADLPADLVKNLGITVVPLYVHFGTEVFRDGVDINKETFFHRLIHGGIHPKTSQPSPEDFANVYRELAKDNTTGIVSIHISSKFSGTYQSAIEGAKLSGVSCPIEVIDSRLLSMGMGLIIKAAAVASRSGKKLGEIVEDCKNSIPKIKLMGFFDTLRYVQVGGRLGKAKILMGSLLGVKPVLTVADGEYQPCGRVRNTAKGLERLVEFAKTGKNIADFSVIHSTTPETAHKLADMLSDIFPKDQTILAQLGAVLGTHGGPGTLWVAYRES